jgi:SAM-dependent methyltransferase
MNIKSIIGKKINVVLRPLGVKIVSQKVKNTEYSYNKVKLPEGAEDYLNQNNERLLELTKLYKKVDAAVITPSVWNNNHLKSVDLRYFRGDNPFVWQFKDGNFEPSYTISTYYILSIDSLNLLDKLNEDAEFGIYTFKINNKIVSRDLLDSIIEIYFLEKHLAIFKSRDINLLDIGAGYGRLAYRIVKAFPNVKYYFCTDAIPASTFISEYYLEFRDVIDKAKVVPLHEIEDTIANNPVDIAINVHSFSECTVAAIDWWIHILTKYKIKYLMIVPNPYDIGKGGEILSSSGEDISAILEKYGYHLIIKEPKYLDPIVQKYGVSPTYHYLFELNLRT